MPESGCPFCADDIVTKQLFSNKSWGAIRNIRPYHGARDHLVFILLRHEVRLSGLTPEEWLDLLGIANMAREHCGKGGALLMRMGNTQETGSTIPHLHAHWITRMAGESAPTVYLPIGPIRYEPPAPAAPAQ